MKPGVALPADHLVAVVLLGQQTEGGLNNSSTQTKNLNRKFDIFCQLTAVDSEEDITTPIARDQYYFPKKTGGYVRDNSRT